MRQHLINNIYDCDGSVAFLQICFYSVSIDKIKLFCYYYVSQHTLIFIFETIFQFEISISSSKNCGLIKY
ncbi:unnamed protein product [Paramecium octaurelia]|uniref:Uncharacterized protein n=1 Tax=Paramecium octaurelia TaxID=43137 RepID=A0A8S1VLS8_PAROT|nr:unnamed protein product [Paramecium octaurelia]